MAGSTAACCVLRIEKSQVVPARAGPLRHRVGFALVAAATDHRIEPIVRRFVERRLRPAVRLEVFQVRQVDRQILFIDRADAARRFARGIELVQDRKRLAPKPLPREEPIAEFVIHGLAAEAHALEVGRNSLFEFCRFQSVVLVGIDRHAFSGEASLAGQHFLALARRNRIARINHRLDRQAELLSKFKVALIVCRNGHDGAGSIANEHVVGHPNRHWFAVHGVSRVAAGEHTGLLLGQLGAFQVALPGGLFAVIGHLFRLLRLGEQIDERVFRRDDHVRCTEQRIRPRRVNRQSLTFRVLHDSAL